MAMVKVPDHAPSMQEIQTGKGVVANVDGSGTQPGLTPPPPSAGTTGPKIASPSVDYNSQQGSKIPAEVGNPVDGSSTYLNQQQQQS